MIFRMPV